jgi:uncharacterized iron-regulated protein
MVTLLAASAALLQSCTLFSGKPPLPKQASVEAASDPASEENFATLVANTDIVYFPAERAASGGRSEPAALLLEALHNTGMAFAIGWNVIDVTQQPLLDDLETKEGRAREEVIARLELVGTGRAREHCRSVLRVVRTPRIRHLALRAPPDLVAKLRSLEMLGPDERKQLPSGFNSPPGGLQAFAERWSPTRSMNDHEVARSYREQLVSQQYAADKIVRFFQAGGDRKLLAFLGGSDLEPGHGVPYYVAQKLQVRQLVLGSKADSSVRAKLLTRASRGIRGAFQIVDGSPRPAFN